MISRLFLPSLAALLLAGCSSTPTLVDHGPIAAKTFSFITRAARPAPSFSDDRQLAHQLIQNAITKNLADHGVSRVDSGGDVNVGYLLIVGNNVSTAAINEHFGYGPDAAELQDKAQAAYTKQKSRTYFEAGTLVIDISDARTSKLLKRGYASRPLLRDLPADARAERVQGVVDEILRDLRIAR